MTRVRKQQEHRGLTAASDTSVGTGSAAVTCPSPMSCSAAKHAAMKNDGWKNRWRCGKELITTKKRQRGGDWTMKAECEHGLDTRLPCGDCQKAYEEENAPSSVQSTSLLDDVRTLFHVLYDAPELNPSNYDHDQVCELNSAMCEAFALCRDLLNRVSSNT